MSLCEIETLLIMPFSTAQVLRNFQKHLFTEYLRLTASGDKQGMGFLIRVHTGHEKPEKQVTFVKSHGKSHEKNTIIFLYILFYTYFSVW